MSTINYSRRRLMSLMVRGVAGGLAGYSLHAFVYAQEADLPVEGYDFLNLNGLGPALSGAEVEESCCPLHTERSAEISEFDSQFQNWASLNLRNLFERNHWQWCEDYRLVVTSQHYGVGQDSQATHQLLSYCQAVAAWLHQRLRGMQTSRYRWALLPDDAGCPQLGTETLSAWVGRYTYLVTRIRVVSADSGWLEPCLVKASPRNRAFNYVAAGGEQDRSPTSLIYIIPGDTALVSPFSEVLHLSTSEPSLAFARATSLAEAVSLGEAVTEALAYTLASEYLKDLDCPRFRQSLANWRRSTQARLPLFERVLLYIHNRGVQAVFSQYLERPAQVLAQI